MINPLILAIDEGTSAAKCMLVDVFGHVVARGSAPLHETHPQPGWVEQDADAIWTAVRTATARTLENHDPRAVVAVGLSTQRESVVIWDRHTGEALAPVLSWQDQRTAATCQTLRTPETEAMVRDRSGLPLDPMFSALKAMWLLNKVDPQRTRARNSQLCIGTVDAWLLSRFAGTAPADSVTEAGNAARTQLLNVRKVDWDDALLALFDIPRAALPRVVSSVGPFPATRNLAPLPDGIPVRAVMGDSHAALFAHGAVAPGQIKATYGTGSSVMGLIPGPDNLHAGVCLTIGWMHDKPAFAAEGNIRAAGSTLKWLADLFGTTPEQMAAEGARIDSHGVSLVPGFTGLGAPWWDRNAVGLITGLTLGSGRAELARAALDAIVHQVADMVEAIDRSVGEVHELFTDGGPTRNDFLMQLQADLIRRPVVRANDTELSALGVAHMAGWAAGVWSWDDLKRLPRQRDVFTNRMDEDERLQARRRWHDAVARARGQAVDISAG